MRYIKEESLANFEFWSGAKDRAELLTYSELKELDSFVEEIFEGREEPPTETEINDLFWFDFDIICEHLGMTEEELDKRNEGA